MVILSDSWEGVRGDSEIKIRVKKILEGLSSFSLNN